jgi:hypothetical protein
MKSGRYSGRLPYELPSVIHSASTTSRYSRSRRGTLLPICRHWSRRPGISDWESRGGFSRVSTDGVAPTTRCPKAYGTSRAEPTESGHDH